MMISHDVLIRIFIAALALCGFFIARYIYNHKTKKTPLMCIARFDCHAVVHSDYSKFLGMRVEILGMIYYALTAILYTFFIFMPYAMSYTYISLYNVPYVSSFGLYVNVAVLFCISLTAFLFSVYLIIVQTFVIKKACSWCIISALICLAIFLLLFFV